MSSINDVLPFAPYIFGATLAAGFTYILIMLITGGIADLDIDIDIDADASADVDGSSEAVGISLNVIAAFAVGVGTIGLLAVRGGWGWLLTLVSAALFGAILGRVLQVLLNFAIRSQGGDVMKENDLIGSEVRVTVDIPAGKMGEGIIEEPEYMKYAIRHMDGAPLTKGAIVVVADVQNGRLLVK